MGLRIRGLLLGLLLLILSLLISCTGGLQRGEDVPPRIDIHTGTEGLMLGFETNMPPEEIFEGGEFQIGIKLDNKGAFNVQDGIVLLSGYDPFFYYIKQAKKTFNIEGKSLYLPDGESDVLVFEISNRGIPEGSEELSSTFVTTACYKYQTQATQEICISPQTVKDENIQMACEPKAEYVLSGQGAPVAVSKIKQRALPGISRVSLAFEITAENKAGGKVRALSAYKKDCEGPSLEKSEIDVVTVKAFLGSEAIECSPDVLKLGLGETKKEPNSVTCKTEVDKRTQAYTSPLIIYLDYGYTISETKALKVTKI